MGFGGLCEAPSTEQRQGSERWQLALGQGLALQEAGCDSGSLSSRAALVRASEQVQQKKKAQREQRKVGLSPSTPCSKGGIQSRSITSCHLSLLCGDCDEGCKKHLWEQGLEGASPRGPLCLSRAWTGWQGRVRVCVLKTLPGGGHRLPVGCLFVCRGLVCTPEHEGAGHGSSKLQYAEQSGAITRSVNFSVWF